MAIDKELLEYAFRCKMSGDEEMYKSCMEQLVDDFNSDEE